VPRSLPLVERDVQLTSQELGTVTVGDGLAGGERPEDVQRPRRDGVEQAEADDGPPARRGGPEVDRSSVIDQPGGGSVEAARASRSVERRNHRRLPPLLSRRQRAASCTAPRTTSSSACTPGCDDVIRMAFSWVLVSPAMSSPCPLEPERVELALPTSLCGDVDVLEEAQELLPDVQRRPDLDALGRQVATDLLHGDARDLAALERVAGDSQRQEGGQRVWDPQVVVMSSASAVGR